MAIRASRNSSVSDAGARAGTSSVGARLMPSAVFQGCAVSEGQAGLALSSVIPEVALSSWRRAQTADVRGYCWLTTFTGTLLFVVVPSPSWPLELLPQQ